MPAYTFFTDARLGDCGTGGLMHLPRYYEMIHGVIENWFEEALDWPMGQMQGSDHLGLVTVDLTTEFPAPSRLGDRLAWKLSVTDIGRSSMRLRISADTGGDARVRATLTLVLVETRAVRSRRWPDAIRARAEDFMLAPPPDAAGSAD